MLRTIPMLLSALLFSGAETLAAQAGTTLPSPTLPSDTLEANFAPRSMPGPMPELAPTLPSDTLEATEPVDSVRTDSSADEEQAPPQTPGDSAALRDLRSWIQRHPGLILPPPVRAVLVRV